MNFNDEEKKVFGVDEDEFFDIGYCFEEYLADVYDVDDDIETKHNLDVTLNFIKKMILELSKRKGYNIIGNECYDTNVLLKEIIDVPKEYEDDPLINFNPLLYKNEDELNNYFYSITKNLSWEELQSLAFSFGLINNGLKLFLANDLGNFIKFSLKLYEELLYQELEIDDKQSPIIETFDDKDDDKFVKDDEVFRIDEIELPPVTDENGNDEWETIFESASDDFNSNNSLPTIKFDEETLKKYIKFINVIEDIVKYRKLGYKILDKLYELVKQKKLDDFYNNEEFALMFDKIMEHDTTHCSYYFHGTQCLEDAQTIMSEGLGMIQDDLTSTSYREFTKDEVILYERGLCGEIGHDAIVIIDVPKNSNGKELNIVTQLQNPSSIHFSPSGLQGLDRKANYIVLPENIVGYVDKKNKQIIFNPKYKNYESFINNNSVGFRR